MEYGQTYFDYQRRIGEFGGRANLFKFAPYIEPDDRVLDFGCGGGYLLNHIDAAEKAGIEINPEARAEAESLGLAVYADVDEVPDEFATVIISNHALEHVEAPLDTLRCLRPKLAPGGTIVFVVPHQKPDEPYRPADPNQHLYTWNPLTLGNLFAAAGYERVEADVIRHAWPPGYMRWHKLLGQRGFDMACRLYARLKDVTQIRAVAQRG